MESKTQPLRTYNGYVLSVSLAIVQPMFGNTITSVQVRVVKTTLTGTFSASWAINQIPPAVLEQIAPQLQKALQEWECPEELTQLEQRLSTPPSKS